MNRFLNKVVVITGGMQGIGRAAAEKFAAEGAKTIIWDTRNEPKQAELEFMEVDVRSSENIHTAAAAVFEKFGRIDVLINNAGITRDATLLKMSDAAWHEVIAVNLTGVYHCCKAVAPLMISNGGGRIINVSSVVGVYGNFGQTNYTASKSGVIGVTKALARELGRKGITVNAVAPGFIKTDMMNTIPENILKTIVEKTPIGRLGDPEDIANVYLFLASNEASFINGAVISVDGGYVG